MSKYVDVCDCNYGDYVFYNGQTWSVGESNYSKGTVTLWSLGGHSSIEINEYTSVELDD